MRPKITPLSDDLQRKIITLPVRFERSNKQLAGARRSRQTTDPTAAI
jgi:hypothetical protein